MQQIRKFAESAGHFRCEELVSTPTLVYNATFKSMITRVSAFGGRMEDAEESVATAEFIHVFVSMSVCPYARAILRSMRLMTILPGSLKYQFFKQLNYRFF